MPSFDLSNVNIGDSNLSSKEEIRKLKSYIYQLTEQLRFTLNNLGTENMNADIISALNQSKTAALKIENLDSSESKKFEELRKKILETAQTIAKEYQSAIEKSESELKASVASMYVAKTEGDTEGTVAELKSFAASLVNLQDDKLEVKFQQIAEGVKSVSDDVEETKDELQEYKLDLETYIRFTIEGVEIGKLIDGNISPFSLLITNEKISFRNYLTEVAYIMYNKLYITDVHITNKLTFGRSDTGYFDFVPSPSGNLLLKWRYS